MALRGKKLRSTGGKLLAAALALTLLFALCLMTGHSLSHLGHKHQDIGPGAECALCAQIAVWQRLMKGLLPWLLIGMLWLTLVSGAEGRLPKMSRRATHLTLIDLQVKLTI